MIDVEKHVMPDYIEDPERPLHYSSISVSIEDLKSSISKINALALNGIVQAVTINCNEPGDLAPLSDLSGIRFLSLASDNPIRLPEGLRVHGVKGLFCSCRRFDTYAFPDLVYLSVRSIDLSRSLFRSSSGLRRIYALGFRTDGDLTGLAGLNKLVDLELVRSNSLVSLIGLQELPELRRLCLAQLGSVQSINEIKSLIHLSNLVIERMKKIESYGAVSKVRGLRRLTITASASIDELDEDLLRSLEILAIWDTKYPARLKNIIQEARSRWKDPLI